MVSRRPWLVRATFLIAVSALATTGCATKKFVRQTVSPIETKVNEQGTQIGRLETTDREHAERIDAVDRRAQQGITAAQAADQKAVAADQKAVAADQKATQAGQAVAQANTRIGGLETRVNNIREEYTAGATATVNFGNDSADLSDQARSTLDGIAGQVGNMNSGYFIEVKGFTDDRGSEGYNFGLSQRRAESVLRYLVSKNVKLHRIQIVGLGEENPVAENRNRAGREQNRRVEVRVYTGGVITR